MNIAKIRAETPGTSDRIHMLACGSSLPSQKVVDAVVDFTTFEARVGGYEAYAAKADMLDGVYDSVARLINAKPREIAIQENATVAWCKAFYALPLKAGDRIITCQAEYGANYVAFLQRKKRDGIEIDIAPSDETGAIDLQALEALVTDRTKLIAITWVPTNGGLVNPAAEVGTIARKYKIPYLIDACQAVGQLVVDVEALQCDFLSATGRKFLRGPRGTGFLYVGENWLEHLEPATLDHFSAPLTDLNHYQMRDDARRFEDWENNYALRAGLIAACDYAMGIGLDQIEARATGLADQLRAGLDSLPGTKVMDLGAQKCAIVSFVIDGLDSAQTAAKLREQSIFIGSTKMGSSMIDAVTRGLPDMLRASPHYYNTEAEIDALVAALDGLIKR